MRAYCIALVDIWLPPKVRQIGKEAFLCCTSLREIVIPPMLRYLGIRAFCGCKQLSLFTQLDEADSDRGVQAEDNTFLMCDNFEREAWIELLPPRDTDSDRRFRPRLVSNQAQVRSSQVSFVVASSAWCGQGFGVIYDELPTKSRF